MIETAPPAFKAQLIFVLCCTACATALVWTLIPHTDVNEPVILGIFGSFLIATYLIKTYIDRLPDWTINVLLYAGFAAIAWIVYLSSGYAGFGSLTLWGTTVSFAINNRGTAQRQAAWAITVNAVALVALHQDGTIPADQVVPRLVMLATTIVVLGELILWLRRLNKREMFSRLRAERMHRRIIDASDDAIFIKGLDGKIITWNRGAQRMYGWTAEEIVGKPVSILAPDERKGEVFDIISRVQRGDGIERYETERVTKWGTRIAVEITATAIDGYDGISVVARDVTSRNEAMVKQLQTAQIESMATIARGVAHDINHILGIVKNYMNFVEKDIDRDPKRINEDMNVIRGAIDQGESIATKLSQFGRETPNGEVRPSSPNTAAEAVEPLFGLSHSDITFDLDTGVKDVMIDPVSLEQVIVNLVLNARDAGANNIAISTFHNEDCSYIEVQDDGEGMDEALTQRAIEPFFTTKPRGEGTGLGLATAYGIVKQADGGLQIESKPGEGTTVTVSLPSVEDSVIKEPAL